MGRRKAGTLRYFRIRESCQVARVPGQTPTGLIGLTGLPSQYKAKENTKQTRAKAKTLMPRRGGSGASMLLAGETRGRPNRCLSHILFVLI